MAKAFEDAAGCGFGQVTSEGLIGLFDTACIGMSDQEPAAIINDEIFTSLTPDRAKEIIAGMKAGKSVEALKGGQYGDGKNSSPLIRSMVNSNIMKKGEVIFSDYIPGSGIKKAVQMSSSEIIQIVKSLKFCSSFLS